MRAARKTLPRAFSAGASSHVPGALHSAAGAPTSARRCARGAEVARGPVTLRGWPGWASLAWPKRRYARMVLMNLECCRLLPGRSVLQIFRAGSGAASSPQGGRAWASSGPISQRGSQLQVAHWPSGQCTQAQENSMLRDLAPLRDPRSPTAAAAVAGAGRGCREPTAPEAAGELNPRIW